MGPLDSLDSIQMGPSANLRVQNTILHSKSTKSTHPGLTKTKTLHPRQNYEYRMQDAQVKNHCKSHILEYGRKW